MTVLCISPRFPPSVHQLGHTIVHMQLFGGFGSVLQRLCKMFEIWENLKNLDAGISRLLTQSALKRGPRGLRKCPILYSPLSSHHLKAFTLRPRGTPDCEISVVAVLCGRSVGCCFSGYPKKAMSVTVLGKGLEVSAS